MALQLTSVTVSLKAGGQLVYTVSWYHKNAKFYLHKYIITSSLSTNVFVNEANQIKHLYFNSHNNYGTGDLGYNGLKFSDS